MVHITQVTSERLTTFNKLRYAVCSFKNLFCVNPNDLPEKALLLPSAGASSETAAELLVSL